jgi:small GTP-binding protein
MSTKDLFSELLKNLMTAIEDISACAIVDRDGLIIHSLLKDQNAEDDTIGTVTAVFDSFIDRVKKDFGSAEEFLNIITVDEKKFLFAAAGPEAILTIITKSDGDENKLKVFCEHIAKKIRLVIEGEEIDTSIPPIVDVLAGMRRGRLPKGEYSLKTIVLGDPMVGKTSLIKRYVDNKFQDNYISTIGVDISRKIVNLSEDLMISMTIWDIGGQIKTMAPYRKRFYSGARQAFLQFDISRRKTFDNIDSWLDDLTKSLDEKIPYIIIANKLDLPNHEVTLEEIKEKAEKLDCPFLLCSAKTGSNINDAFQYAGYKFCERL